MEKSPGSLDNTKNELSLPDLLRIVVRYRVLVLGVIAATIVGGIIAGLMADTVYRASAEIQVGRYAVLFPTNPYVDDLREDLVENPRYAFVESPYVLAQRLWDEHQRGDRNIAHINDVKVLPRPRSHVLKVISNAPSAVEAEQFLRKVLQEVVVQHNAILASRAKEREQELNRIDENKREITVTLDLIQRQKNRLASNPSLLIEMLMGRMTLQRRLHTLQIREAALMTVDPDFDLGQSEILEEFPPSKVRPRWPLFLSVSLFLGITLGVALAYFAHLLEVFQSRRITAAAFS